MSGSPVAYETLDALRDGIVEMGNTPPEYWDKMMHKVPSAPVVQRVSWLLERCKGKVVLHLGSASPLHEELRKVCAKLYGVDHVAKQEPGYYCVDLDRSPDDLPILPDVEVVLAGEVLEHLSGPGWLLAMLKESYTCPLLITVPNAFCPQPRLQDGYECVHFEHKSWYSYWTLKTLVESNRYTIQRFMWYNGKPMTAEGLIMEVL